MSSRIEKLREAGFTEQQAVAVINTQDSGSPIPVGFWRVIGLVLINIILFSAVFAFAARLFKFILLDM